MLDQGKIAANASQSSLVLLAFAPWPLSEQLFTGPSEVSRCSKHCRVTIELPQRLLPMTRTGYRGAWHNWVLFCAALVFVVLGASAWLSGDEVGVSGKIVGSAFVSFWLPLAVRIARAGVIPTSEGVIIRGGFRTRKLPWEQISRFGVARGDAPLPSEMIVVELIDGRMLKIGEVSSSTLFRRSPSHVRRVASQLNEELRRLGRPR